LHAARDITGGVFAAELTGGVCVQLSKRLVELRGSSNDVLSALESNGVKFVVLDLRKKIGLRLCALHFLPLS